jgi:hypothetical protein
MTRIENAAADSGALRDEELSAVTGGESKPKGSGGNTEPKPRPPL